MRDVCLLESEEMGKDYEYCTADILNYDLLKEFACNNRKHPTEAEIHTLGLSQKERCSGTFSKATYHRELYRRFCMPTSTACH